MSIADQICLCSNTKEYEDEHGEQYQNFCCQPSQDCTKWLSTQNYEWLPGNNSRWAATWENQQCGFWPRSDTNQAIQLPEMARRWKFWISEVERLHYPSSENKGADQLRGYREADLRLCFRICWLNVGFLIGAAQMTLSQVILAV